MHNDQDPPTNPRGGTHLKKNSYLVLVAKFACGSVRLSQQHDESYQTNTLRPHFSIVGSSVEVPVKRGVWTGGDLRTYEFTCKACVGLEPKSRWHIGMGVQA